MKRGSKHSWPAMRWNAWIAAAVAAVVVLICALNSLRWINRPFPGFFLWENLFVPAIGDTDWSGYEAGVPTQSRLLTVNGHPVGSADEVYRSIERLPIGTPIAYTFAGQHADAPVERTVPTMRLTLPEYLWTLGNYLIVGALLVSLGFVVFLLRPDAPAARAMLAAVGIWGLYFVTSADIFGPGWFRPLCLVLQALGPVTLLHLALTFPVERTFLTRHRHLLPALYGAALAIGVAHNLVFHRSFAAVLAINRVFVVALTLGGLVLMGSLAYSLLFPASAAARQRTKIAVLGGLVAFFTPVAGFVLYLIGVSFPLNFVTLPMALFPLAVGYAIVKHDLFEVDTIIRRTLAWAILTGLIAALYLGGVGTLELLFTGRIGRAAQLFFLLAIVSLFNPLRNRVQAAVDFLFARDRYDYRNTVGEASQALAALLDIETVVARILHTITDTIHVDFGAVWLHQDGGYQLQAVAATSDTPQPPQRLVAESAVVRQLQQSPQRILNEDEAGEHDQLLAAELGRLGATLVVPMTFERTLIGFLALGKKESGRFYSREDLGLLRTLANQGAVAVENARSYRALVTANDDLRATQSRLIEAERFAAIGELSAAVAHGIRNPLAGIKAAAQFASLELPASHPLHENITDIISESDKLESRIRTLLDFAKPFEPRLAPCRIGKIVDGAVASLRSQMAAQRIELTTDIDAALPEADLDYAQIEQVLLVLLSNALEAMTNGGRILVAARLLPEKRVRLEVVDTGPGIPRDQLPRIFKLFFTTKSSGTGLGLAFAKKIVEQHRGTITVESTVGRGTSFTIDLPLEQQEPAARADRGH